MEGKNKNRRGGKGQQGARKRREGKGWTAEEKQGPVKCYGGKSRESREERRRHISI